MYLVLLNIVKGIRGFGYEVFTRGKNIDKKREQSSLFYCFQFFVKLELPITYSQILSFHQQSFLIPLQIRYPRLSTLICRWTKQQDLHICQLQLCL